MRAFRITRRVAAIAAPPIASPAAEVSDFLRAALRDVRRIVHLSGRALGNLLNINWREIAWPEVGVRLLDPSARQHDNASAKRHAYPRVPPVFRSRAPSIRPGAKIRAGGFPLATEPSSRRDLSVVSSGRHIRVRFMGEIIANAPSD